MAKIYFNDSIIKHLKETTILNFFKESGPDGKTIFIRDTREDVYSGKNYIYGDVKMYQKDGDYYIDINKQTLNSSTVLGVYVGEGYDFGISSEKDPVFVVAQKRTEMSLGMLPDMKKGIDVPEVAMGMFHLGTIISFKRDGVPMKDELTAAGWKRILGPEDSTLGIMTTEEAFKNKLENSKKDEFAEAKKNIERIERIKDAKLAGEIEPVLADNLIQYYSENTNGVQHVFYFLASDIKKLQEKGIL